MKRKNNRYPVQLRVRYVVFNGSNESAVFSLIGDYVLEYEAHTEDDPSMNYITFNSNEGSRTVVESNNYVCIDYLNNVRICDEDEFNANTEV